MFTILTRIAIMIAIVKLTKAFVKESTGKGGASY